MECLHQTKLRLLHSSCRVWKSRQTRARQTPRKHRHSFWMRPINFNVVKRSATFHAVDILVICFQKQCGRGIAAHSVVQDSTDCWKYGNLYIFECDLLLHIICHIRHTYVKWNHSTRPDPLFPCRRIYFWLCVTKDIFFLWQKCKKGNWIRCVMHLSIATVHGLTNQTN